MQVQPQESQASLRRGTGEGDEIRSDRTRKPARGGFTHTGSSFRSTTALGTPREEEVVKEVEEGTEPREEGEVRAVGGSD